MNNEVAMWIGGILITGAYAVGGFALKIALSAYHHIAMRSEEHGEKIVRIETMLEIQGKTMARSLHSPHTPELDALLEKYYARNYELSYKEWERLLDLCNRAIEDNAGTEKADYAEFLAGVCHHKLRHLPPMQREQKLEK